MSRSGSGKSSRIWIFTRFFIASSLMIYLPFMLLLKQSPSFDQPYFFGSFFWGWLGLCLFYTAFGMVWQRCWMRVAQADNPNYDIWLEAGGDPYFDHLPWPANANKWTHRMAIGTPPDFDYCPNCGDVPLGEYYGNQCGCCGFYFDNFYDQPPPEEQG